jgi:hypothetical protein
MPGSMRRKVDTASLKKLTITAIRDTLKEVRSKRPNSSGGEEKRFQTATCSLLEAQEYVVGAWDTLAVGNVCVSVAISRWILEAAMNLWWMVSNEDETEQRLTDLAREALRQEANLLDALGDLFPDRAHTLGRRARMARQAMADLKCMRVDSFERRMKDNQPPDSPGWPSLYVLYRICCAAAHPGLRGWERFRRVGQATVSAKPSGNTMLTPKLATWVIVSSVLYLVSFAHCLTQTGDLESLTNWWNAKVSPLLG